MEEGRFSLDSWVCISTTLLVDDNPMYSPFPDPNRHLLPAGITRHVSERQKEGCALVSAQYYILTRIALSLSVSSHTAPSETHSSTALVGRCAGELNLKLRLKSVVAVCTGYSFVHSRAGCDRHTYHLESQKCAAITRPAVNTKTNVSTTCIVEG